MRFLLALVTLLLVSVSTAEGQEVPVAIESWSLERMTRMGEAIAAQDRAAIAAGERLRRNFNGEDPPGLVGWIAIAEGETQRVRFLAAPNGELQAGWDVVVTRNRAGPVTVPTDPSLTAEERAQYAARRTAAANVGEERCGRYNIFALRDPDGEDWLVWLLATVFKGKKTEIGRFKGLGEMMASQLKETTMDPKKRTLARVTVPASEDEIEDLVERLMGKKAEARFQFIQDNAQFAAADLDV